MPDTSPERAVIKPRLRPLHHHLVSCGSIGYSASLYGGEDWSLRPLQKPGDSEAYPELTARLLRVARHLGVTEFVAPRPDFSGHIVSHKECDIRIPLAPDVTLRRGVAADGVTVPIGSAFVMSTGGCPVTVAIDGHTLIAAHMGLECLLRYKPENMSGYRGVVEQLAECFPNPRQVSSRVWFSIRPEDYLHSPEDAQYARENVLLHARLKELGLYDAAFSDETAPFGIVLPRIIVEQMERVGFPTPFTSKETSLQDERAHHTRRQSAGHLRNLVVIRPFLLTC